MTSEIVHIREVISWHELNPLERALVEEADDLVDVHRRLSQYRNHLQPYLQPHFRSDKHTARYVTCIMAARYLRVSEKLGELDREKSELYKVVLKMLQERRIMRNERTTHHQND